MTPEDFRDQLVADLKGLPIPELAKRLVDVQASLAEAEAQVSHLKTVRDIIRFEVIPSTMDDQGIQSVNIKGVGTLYLSGEVLVSVKQAMGPDLQDWLRDHGFGDLISEVVNSSTLAAFVREQMKAGHEVPEHLLNIHPRTRAAIKKG